MGWTNEIGGLLQQYAGGGGGANVHQDFDRVVNRVEPDELGDGIASAFRTGDAPFGQMVGQLFAQGNGVQQSGLLNSLLSSVEPEVISRALGNRGLAGIANLLLANQGSLTPDQAAQVPPDAVEALANHAQEANPGVLDSVGGLLASHPELVKNLGGGFLGNILGGLAQTRLAA